MYFKESLFFDFFIYIFNSSVDIVVKMIGYYFVFVIYIKVENFLFCVISVDNLNLIYCFFKKILLTVFFIFFDDEVKVNYSL